jgi:hypothetical protein
MKKILRFSLVLSALLVPAALMLYATDHPASTAGKFLLLDNDRVMEGEIVRLADRYRVRRSIGELWLPAEKVRFVGNSWEEVLAYQHGQANLIDPDERLRLARWCHVNDLRPQALQEVKEALRLQPNFPAARALQRTLEHVVASTSPAPAVVPPTAPLAAPPVLDLNGESMGEFVGKVQPILMNTCASCHASDQGKRFHLLRTYGSGPALRRTTQINLAAVMEQINFDQPELSPVLIKAVSAHGIADNPPLVSRKATPYRILHDWIETTLTNNPHLKSERLALTSAIKPTVFPPMATVPAAPPERSGFASGPRTVASVASAQVIPNRVATAPRVLPAFPDSVPEVAPEASNSFGSLKPATTTTPAATTPTARLTTVAPAPAAQTASPAPQPEQPGLDAYSPAPFNQQMHPNRKAGNS